MTKYSLINCYSDNNKGDLGIILSTIDYIRNNDPGADIIGVSTYNYSDPSFHTEHVLLNKTIDVYPSIFGELNIGGNKSQPIKLIKFFWDTIRLILFLILPASISAKFLFSKNEKKTFLRLKESDFIVSKGGSFICNDLNMRSKIALLRFVYIFLLSFKLSKKVIILNQSIGPVYGKFSIKIVNYILKKCDKVVLRENECIEQYQYLSFPKDTIISNDIAFYLEPKEVINNFQDGNINIGITMKYVDKGKESEYQTMWIEFIEYVLQNYKNTKIIIFNQVPIDKDIEASWMIYKKINDIYKEKIIFMTNDYESSMLKYLYGKMDFFVGTRLHSAIFAMGELVPTICISYHGTKAEGIFNNMGVSEFVVQEYDDNILINKFGKLFLQVDKCKDNLKNKLLNYQEKMKMDFTKIFHV
jgi:colanic acid/amylovoran biosynthesis protein